MKASMGSPTGIVVDINRFSLHDGPGIRTTVFLKGCPLSCRWCHNPEAILHRPQLSFDPAKCTDCFKCVDVCTSGAHSILSNKHHVDLSRCELAGDCVTACPNEAISIVGKARSMEDVTSVILRDKDYYRNSGGGVTISGGEPMTQFEYTKALLRSCKEGGIHTALDTCGHVPADHYRAVLPYVDLFLYDYKATDNEKHRHYTGVSNNLILSNLDMLYKANATILLRCPIVPGFNDTEEHFRGICNISLRYPGLAGIQLMPYHNMGFSKAQKIGAESEFINLKTTEKEVSRRWAEHLSSLGCSCITVR